MCVAVLDDVLQGFLHDPIEAKCGVVGKFCRNSLVFESNGPAVDFRDIGAQTADRRHETQLFQLAGCS